MSTVDKMLIKGIRSFDPENKNVITFFKPLTLIVGSNGAGKTTIIECLKLSCTGELPPNARSGHSFIHDPKVAGETETKGQIKLRFKTAAGKDVVCIRSFQLTQKASKMEYKAIESVLQTINPHTGELRESIAQDQEKTESLKSQIEDLEKSIENQDAKIHDVEKSLKDLRQLEDQKSAKTAVRNVLFKEQQKQYAALAEENEDTDEELMEWKTKFDERIMLLQNKIQQMERSLQDLTDEGSACRRKLETYIKEIGKLQRDAEESNEMKLKAAWDCYMGANDRWNTAEAQKNAKLQMKQRVKAASSAEHLKALGVESSSAESYYQQLDRLHITYEEYIKIRKETIPLAEKTLSELTEELDQKTQAHYDVLGVLAQIKTDKDSVEILVEPVETADRLFQQIQSGQKLVEDLEYKLDLRGQGGKSLEEIQLELNNLQSTR
ncbi:DNA repair protein Rad50 [Corchorus olitorius]|uniref:DNA repair protein Rad50 n=1 Tax=Corchorus olitorius TaxID=93759 RepID=A0A1R3J136_9ROSI|nr:DNA repair protein Rad50 [Corchorus olitorius]